MIRLLSTTENKMIDIAILTQQCYLQLDMQDPWQCQIALEEAWLAQALREQGLSVKRLAWDDPEQDWSRVRGAVLRSTWDYSQRSEEFEAWLDKAGQQTLLFNRYDLLRWNMDKHYLRDLAEQEVAIVPSVFVAKGQQMDLLALAQRFGWNEVIIKPVVSAAARDTLRLDLQQPQVAQQALNAASAREATIVQPFLPSVLLQGELSLIVIGGEVCHAVRKTPCPGDFRVQDDHGGQVMPYIANAEEIAFAEQAVAACPVLPLYARVDVLRDQQGRLRLLELELIEPELFFRFNPLAAASLAQQIRNAL